MATVGRMGNLIDYRTPGPFTGRTGEDYDALLDELAAVCEADDSAAVADLYRNPVFEVPSELLR